MTDSTEGWVREILYPISATDRLVELTFSLMRRFLHPKGLTPPTFALHPQLNIVIKLSRNVPKRVGTAFHHHLDLKHHTSISAGLGP